MRNFLIAGNWKMNKTIAEALEFAKEAKKYVPKENVELAILAPFTHLPALSEELRDSDIKLGAQNVHFEAWGAYTGEVSVEMLKELGLDYCVVGHSERREYFAETDESINKKLKALIREGITPILCVGESLAIREMNNHTVHVATQILQDTDGLTTEEIQHLVIAYEPIWAIGTGKTATPEEAEFMCGYIRGLIAGSYDNAVAENMRILYGGSMKPENAGELLAKLDIDGGLIGGASLKSESFIDIADQAK